MLVVAVLMSNRGGNFTFKAMLVIKVSAHFFHGPEWPVGKLHDIKTLFFSSMVMKTHRNITLIILIGCFLLLLLLFVLNQIV